MAKLYVSEIVRLHAVPVSIISGRDPCLTSQFLKKLHEALDRQKSYVDLKCKEIEDFVGDFVVLKVSPWKKVLRFGQKGKLSPRFTGPYRIQKCVGPIAYQLELPPKLDRIHDVFHISMLRHYRSDPAHVISVEEIEVKPDLTFEEELIQILEHDVKVLRKKSIPLAKISVKEFVINFRQRFKRAKPHSFNQGRFGARGLLRLFANKVCKTLP
ncbi:uncharacterized protein LOC128295394 [Gossypium arboreum]|uniref:uncharacterized protein LOC128295394 n=1 Tax=Gossypium arboreum TaxID=29729 RepID=UPI0022F18DFF|nr:uncharacterized protein LOC128295394 [Gossypium arboreum]